MPETIEIKLTDDTPDVPPESRPGAPAPAGTPQVPQGTGRDQSAEKLAEAASSLEKTEQKRQSVIEEVINARADYQNESDLAFKEDPDDRFPWERPGYDDGIPDDDSHLDRIGKNANSPSSQIDDLGEAIEKRRAEREEKAEQDREASQRRAESAAARREQEREERRKQASTTAEKDSKLPVLERMDKFFEKHGINSNSKRREEEGKPRSTEGSNDDGSATEAVKGAIVEGIAEKIGSGFKRFLGNSKIGRSLLSFGSGAAARSTAAAGATGAAGAGATGGALASSAAVPPVAAILAVVAVFAGLAIATKKVLDLYEQQADELEEFSGAITGAKAGIEVAEFKNKLERAQRIGGDVAQVTAARGRLNDALYDLTTSLLDRLAAFTPLLEAGIDMATVTVRQLDVLVNIAELMFERTDVLKLTEKTSREAANELLASIHELTEAQLNVLIDNKEDGESLGVDTLFNTNPVGPNKANPFDHLIPPARRPQL